MDGDGAVLGDVQNQIRQEIVVPDPHQFQNTHGNEGRLQHGQHHVEVGAHGTAAVNGRRFLDFQRQTLDEAHEHEDGKTRAEAQIDHGNRPGGVQLQGVGGGGQGEHDHLEGDDHGEQAQIVEELGKAAPHPGNIPRRHGAAQQDQRRGNHADEQAVAHGLEEGVIAEGHTLDIVGKAHEALRIGQGKHVQIDGIVGLQGVDDNLVNGHDPHKANQHEGNGQHRAAGGILFGFHSVFTHHCCTSLRRVAVCWAMARTATRIKKITAFAWATPCQFLLML